MPHPPKLLTLLSLVLFLLLGGCSSLPPLNERPHSSALPLEQTLDTRLGKSLALQVIPNHGSSGLYPLADAREAFAARMQLLAKAERSIDIQSYIWRDDLSGSLLFNAVREAADRGVRVRLLLDDNNTLGMDPLLAALDGHPQIEVRLFNPFSLRSSRVLGFITHFSRANRRMHNKSFTVDNQVTIIGGRNIGDEYFDVIEGMLFIDLDVLAIGPVVQEVTLDFDRYWSSQSTHAGKRLLAPAQPDGLHILALRAEAILEKPRATNYLWALREITLVDELMHGRVALEWAPTRMVSDDPAKGLGLAEPEGTLPYQLMEIIGEPQIDVDLISPYLVPTAFGVEALSQLAQQGIRISILTNALEATDVAVVHAGYAKRRKALLKAGITLYEMRLLTPEHRPATKAAGPFGSSGSSLHAKTFAVDGSRIFIGSFNFDPRSTELNTELGFVIDSPTMAKRISATFDTAIPANAYEVRLDKKGRLYWLERRGDELIRHRKEPGTHLLQRLGIRMLSWLPIEWLL